MKDKKVIFLTPGVGLSGSCQLMVNLAISLKTNGYSPEFFICTKKHDNCFPEMKNKLLPVTSYFEIIPNSFFNKFFLLFAMFKMCLLTLWVLLFEKKADLFVIDLNCYSLPILWLFRKKTLFYCHFPDKLLSLPGRSIVMKFYQFVTAIIEEFCMFFATKILVNSEFTKHKFYSAFPILDRLKVETQILYPSIDFSKFDVKNEEDSIEIITKRCPFFFSLNRFEEKKNFELAIRSFYEFKKISIKNDNHILVLAGGSTDNSKGYLNRLDQLTNDLGLNGLVKICQNISHSQRIQFLKKTVATLYTPENEHFGIVPIEAMFMERPVIGQNNGGPTESISKESGFLLEANPKLWGEKMKELGENKAKSEKMGKNGRINVMKNFSFEIFQREFNETVNKIINQKSRNQK